MADKLVPASPEVIAEEISERLAESIPREEQGELLRTYVRALSEEMALLEQWVYGG